MPEKMKNLMVPAQGLVVTRPTMGSRITEMGFDHTGDSPDNFSQIFQIAFDYPFCLSYPV
jgi:hypothetical protein